MGRLGFEVYYMENPKTAWDYAESMDGCVSQQFAWNRGFGVIDI